MKRSDVAAKLRYLNTIFPRNLLTANDHLLLEYAARMLKTAHWEWNEDEHKYQCSNCQARIESTELFRNSFCYHCGAEMTN